MYGYTSYMFMFMCLFVVGTVMPCAGRRDLNGPAVQPSSVSPRRDLPLLRPDNEISARLFKSLHIKSDDTHILHRAIYVLNLEIYT